MLDTQIHVYSLDTACFYNQKELVIHNKLLRLYKLRADLNRKIEQNHTDLNYYQRARVQRFINYLKIQLQEEFQVTREQNVTSGTIRQLRPETLIDRNVVSVFDSFLTRTLGCTPNCLTKELMIVQVYFYDVAEDIIKQGFNYNGEKYVLFSASAGQIRTKKFVVVKESSLKQHEKTLMCGLTIEKINEKGGVNPNKFLAYYALANSATEVWEGFDIDKAIVVEDFETVVRGEVDYIDDEDYSITRRLMDVPVPNTDGCGLVLSESTTMCRLPWVKGLLVQFDFRKFIREHENHPNTNHGIVKDIYGTEHDIIAEDIQYIFSKSQFKLWKMYDSWDEYKTYFKQYGCTAGKCNEEEDEIPDARINYQMLQSLTDMTKREMERLAKRTIKDIDKLGNDYRTTMKLLGVSDNTLNQNYIQKSLAVYPELMRDPYNKHIVKDTQRSLVKQAKAGRLMVNGKYTFISPDLYAFCEWLFLGIENPDGLLGNGEVSCNLFKDGVELDCLRSPHLYVEHAVRKNCVNEKTKEWFDTKCIYTSTKDLISKVLMFDCDGDKALVVNEPLLTKIAKRNTEGIVPLYYNMHKAKPSLISHEVLYDNLNIAYNSGNIGLYSNSISKIDNSGNMTDEKRQVIKWLCLENNICIDGAKNLRFVNRPLEVDKIIKPYTNKKLPHFFKYAKDKTSSQVESWKPTPVNYLEQIVGNPVLRIKKTVGKLDYRMLMYNQDFKFTIVHADIIEKYDWCNTHKWFYYNRDAMTYGGGDTYVYQQIRKEILSLPFSKNDIVDALVYYLFTERKSSLKNTFWECFGKEVYENLQKNVPKDSRICPICGNRIYSEDIKRGDRIYCSDECALTARIEQKRKIPVAKNGT